MNGLVKSETKRVGTNERFMSGAGKYFTYASNSAGAKFLFFAIHHCPQHLHSRIPAWLPASSTRIIVRAYHIPCLWPAHARSPAGYTIVFKDDVTEETVLKYMSDIVHAGGCLTQAYDSFLNVRVNQHVRFRPPSFVPHRHCRCADIYECHDRRASAPLSLRLISRY